MSPAPPCSTLKRPTERQLAGFRASAIGDDTVETYLRKGWSLAICCRDCPRLVEWTPAELERRYGRQLLTRIAAIAGKLKCSAADCGSHDIAVFPHAFDGEWRWEAP